MSVAERSIAGQITYDDLYRRWEEGNWKATELDFSEDRNGWDSLNEIQRKSALWIYSMFFYGEDAVADGLSPYIEAAPKEEQKYFLATQQVDEARHAVFFHRFFKEVIGVEGDIASGLEFAQSQLGWGYRNVMSVGDANLFNSDAQQLANGARLTNLYAIACTTSSIDFPCIAESFMGGLRCSGIVTISILMLTIAGTQSPRHRAPGGADRRARA